MLCDQTVLEQWLKSGVIEKGVNNQTNQGTPQGGIISPSLCNIALNGLESAAKKAANSYKSRSAKVHLTRYADDFICTGFNQTILEESIKPAIAEFLKERGLEFKDSKTRIINIEQGFDFLGFTIQRKPWDYKLNQSKKKNQTPPDTVLIIQPRHKKIMALKNSIRKVI